MDARTLKFSHFPPFFFVWKGYFLEVNAFCSCGKTEQAFHSFICSFIHSFKRIIQRKPEQAFNKYNTASMFLFDASVFLRVCKVISCFFPLESQRSFSRSLVQPDIILIPLYACCPPPLPRSPHHILLSSSLYGHRPFPPLSLSSFPF